MSKITSNGNIKIVWILEADLTDPDAPALAELNNDGIDISAAIAFDGYEVGATDSDDIDDRALTDLGSAVTRGFANYAATLPIFADADASDTNSVYNDALDAFKVGLTNGYLVTRVAKSASIAFEAGDRVSVFKFQNGIPAADGTGDTVKYVVDFLPQGLIEINTLPAIASPLIATPATDSIATGEHGAISVTLGGVDVTHSCTYSSANTALLSVSDLGVYSWIAAGGPTTITVSHPSANASDTVAVTTT